MRHKPIHRLPFLLFCFLFTFVSSPSLATDRPEFETPHFKLRLAPRTPNQIAAFYEGRGFPDTAIRLLQDYCFITVSLRNKGTEILWFDLDNWQFQANGKTLPRIKRSHWQTIWQEIALKKRFQATFRWTLMPEKLDFRAYETEAGNIILPYSPHPIRLTAQIKLGSQQTPTSIQLNSIRCSKDP